MLKALVASSVLCFVLVLNGFAIDNCCRDVCYDSGQTTELLDVVCIPSDCPECIVTVVYQERRYREVDEDCGDGTNWHYELYIDNIFFENCENTCTNDSSACSPKAEFDNTNDKVMFAIHCLLRNHIWRVSPPSDTSIINSLTVTLRTPGCFDNQSFGLNSKQYLFCDGYHCCSYYYYLQRTLASECYYDIISSAESSVDRGVDPDTTCTRDCLDPDCSDFCLFLKFMDLEMITSIEYGKQEDISFKVFPNPSRDELSVQLEDLIIDEIVIFDLLGKVKIKKSFSENEPRSDLYKISVEDLEPSVYLMSIKNKGDIIGTTRFNVFR